MTHPNLAAIAATLPQVKSGKVRAFLDYMQRIHPADRLPGRRDIDPLDVPDLLANMILVEVHRQPAPEPARFFARIVGEAILTAAPVPVMNRYLDDMAAEAQSTPGGNARVSVDTRQQVLDSGRMYYWHGRPRMKFSFDYADVEYAHCPLADDGITIDRIVSTIYYSGA